MNRHTSRAAVVPSPAAATARAILFRRYRAYGIAVAVLSGMSYGLYSAFMTLGMSLGIWGDWYGEGSELSAVATLFLLSALGAAVTDSFSALWALLLAAFKGKLGDVPRSWRTRPGAIMTAAAFIGGPLASTCYVLGLQNAGSVVVPMSALCPAIGAILGRVVFGQTLNLRIMAGIFICFAASVMIGSTGLTDDAPANLYLGLAFGLLAALGWGIEGCVCGYGTALIDPEVGITIRQITSGLSNLILLVPLFGWLGGADAVGMAVTAFTDGGSVGWFVVAGFCAYFAFMLWYQGNAMCGAALGMACNGAFSFWGPFFIWLVLGVYYGMEGKNMPPIAWLASLIMIGGIFLIAVDPMTLFRRGRKGRGDHEAA
ncbi:hypothetical protein [uncultured Desulfovibrio sp.]|uniref:hypothetical protein n=1 Tax=uncultured Desulfovibrio sp. TaxID=167968 RepID=UPI002637ECCD|nr:hypothetical protein [uncultured Desulfovibrio sp.]